MNEKITIRCAIYTRKSTEEGLELDYNSLDAQRDAAEAYIKSQKHEGWMCLPEHYDDGGYTGGNLDRPAAQRLLADVEDGKINCIVVYKVDRLSRSLLDFARIIQILEKHNVSFVSVTQQFNILMPPKTRAGSGLNRPCSRKLYLMTSHRGVSNKKKPAGFLPLRSGTSRYNFGQGGSPKKGGSNYLSDCHRFMDE